MSKVLIVDDSAVMRKIIKKNVKESSLVVDEFIDAGSGDEALKIVSQDNIDLILCDWNMPNMSGIEFVKELRSLEFAKETPIIIVTTEGTDSKMEKAEKAGADGFITKPFTPDDLRKVLGKYLSKDEGTANLGILEDVKIPLIAELGKTEMIMCDVLALSPGTIVKLDSLAGEPVKITVRGKTIAQGEVVVVDENFGVKITKVVNERERIENTG